MKANAPEKIYIPRLEGNETFVHEWSATKFRKYFSREIAENIEYTRTDACADAFIEKAVEWLSRHFYDEEYQSTDNEGTWICADELIKDFKKYMKGE